MSREAAVVSEQKGLAIEPYRIVPGDIITVHYYKNYRPASETAEDVYRLDIGDRVLITVYRHPEYTKEAVVLPDGSISVPMIGRIKAQGLTPTTLEENITELYRAEFVNPEIDVFVIEAQNKLNDFLNLLFKNSGSDKIGSFTVRTDGRIDLPLIGDTEVAGLTLYNARSAILGKYNEKFYDSNLDISINVVSSNHAKVAILGEVSKPGVYPLSGKANPLYAVALAGGQLETADLTKVVILRGQSADSVQKIYANTEGMEIAKGDIYVQPGDVIYIPKTGIANVDLFVDQYIRKLIPFNLGTGFYYNLR